MEQMETSGTHPSIDLFLRYAGPRQLPSCHDAMLILREGRHPRLDRPRRGIRLHLTL
jgi:hypothetical protein